MRLTDRQRELLDHLIDGAPNKHIARAMNVTEGTIKMMLHLLYVRFDVPNRTALAGLYTRRDHENQDSS